MGAVRIESLNKDNYDTWKIQMEALLIKNDAWNYVDGMAVKPEVADGNTASAEAARAWMDKDNKARSDLILSINPSELKQVKDCATWREVWLRLENIYQSKVPARKVTLLKKLTLHKMTENGDVREHVRGFFDAVDKLSEMNVDIHDDLLAIMLLYSLPSKSDNFRCAIESRDELPNPETLRIKIIEESNAQSDNVGESMVQNAMVAKKFAKNRSNYKNKTKISMKIKSSATNVNRPVTKHRSVAK